MDSTERGVSKLQIGVFGSRRRDLDRAIYDAAERIGARIAILGHVLVTGAATGVSACAAEGARRAGGIVVGVSPWPAEPREQVTACPDDIDTLSMTVLIASGFGHKGRNVVAIRSCDCVLIVNGGFGALNEATIAVNERRWIGCLEGSGGAADLLRTIVERLGGYERIVYARNPERLVDDLISAVQAGSTS